MIIGLAAVAASAMPANAAAPAPPADGCVLVAQQPDERTKTIPLVEVCGSQATAQVSAAQFVTLARYYQDANFTGVNQQDVVGGYGTCDREGYTFSVNGWWSDNLSSYRLFGSCAWSTVTNSWGNTRYGALGDQAYVGDSWNDDVTRFRTWAR